MIPKTRLTGLRLSAVELLGSLVLLFVVSPFLEWFPRGEELEGALLSAVLILAILTVRGSRKTLAAAGVLIFLALGGKWLNHFRPDLVPVPMFVIPTIIFVAMIVVLLMRFILYAPHVDRAVLCAGLANFLLIGLLWAFGYQLVGYLAPASFTFSDPTTAGQGMDGFNSFYFSFVTLSTVGYGDIAPVSRVARMLAAMEAITGALYIAVMIARLVALHIVRDSSKEPL